MYQLIFVLLKKVNPVWSNYLYSWFTRCSYILVWSYYKKEST